MSATIPAWWLMVLTAVWIAALFTAYEMGKLFGYKKGLRDARIALSEVFKDLKEI